MMLLVTNVANWVILHACVREKNLEIASGVALGAAKHTVTECAIARQGTD